MSTDELTDLLARLQEDSSVLLDSEEATKQGIILPILARVGWDRDNIREVVPEHRVENGRVDYCLRIGPRSAVFVEAKRTDQDLEGHQEQLLDYAFREGVELAALTNGRTWWLYLPLVQGSWDQRKFFTVDIAQQDPSDVADHFRQFLSKVAVADGSAVKSARQVHESREKERLTTATLPKAWAQLLSEPDELLGELLAERVESLCGHQPSQEQVAHFLARLTASPHKTSAVVVAAPARQPDLRAPATLPGDFTFRRPTGFAFLGSSYSASTWKEVLVGFCQRVAERHRSDFDKVLQLKGRKRDYFARDYRGMTSPEAIPGTDIYVETNLSANDVAARCRQVLRVFGYARTDFDIKVR